MRAGYERLALRDRLLGARAMQQVHARLVEAKVATERQHTALLQRELELEQARDARERVERRFDVMLAMLLAGVLVAVSWRWVASRRENRRLAERNRVVEAQSATLSALNARLAERAETDALTGLPNRAAALDRLTVLLAEGRRVAVAIADVDHFKRINDTRGHLAGDATLKRVAQTLRDALACAEIVGRLGGEEFLAVLSGADAEGAQEHFDAARRAIGALSFEQGLRITASFGWCLAEPGAAAVDALAAADAALYRAKAGGRDRVEAHGTLVALAQQA